MSKPKEEDYLTLADSWEVSATGLIAVQVKAAASGLKDMDLKSDECEELNNVVWRATQDIRRAIKAVIWARDPARAGETATNESEISSLFPEAETVFMEPIPNGYCSDYCCRHLPWFIVTTNLGRFKVGWRKRVIHIEWTDTVVKQTADELFPAEDVTKGGRTIHAWSVEKGREYVERVFLEFTKMLQARDKKLLAE